MDGLSSSAAASAATSRSPTMPIAIGKGGMGISPNGMHSIGSSNQAIMMSGRYAAQSAPAPKAPIIGSLPAPKGFADDMKRLELPPPSPATTPPKGSVATSARGVTAQYAIQGGRTAAGGVAKSLPANDSAFLHSLQISSSLKQTARIPSTLAEQSLSPSAKKPTQLELVKEETNSPYAGHMMDQDEGENISYSKSNAMQSSSYSSVLKVLTGNEMYIDDGSASATSIAAVQKDDTILNQKFSTIGLGTSMQSQPSSSILKKSQMRGNRSSSESSTEKNSTSISFKDKKQGYGNKDMDVDMDDNEEERDSGDELQFQLS